MATLAIVTLFAKSKEAESASVSERERSVCGHIIKCMFGMGGYSGHNTFSCLLVVVVILFLYFSSVV